METRAGIKLSPGFYQRADVVVLARDLLGKFLVTEIEGVLTSGMITETEAYAGETDRASHAFGGRYTARTHMMYQQGGVAYVYLCYGIHSLFNVVTNVTGRPHAVLIRAIQPAEGLETMLRRANLAKAGRGFCKGPGKLSRALGIHYSHSGADLQGGLVWIEDRGVKVLDATIQTTARIGVGYAGVDADLPYRFVYHPE